MIDEVFYSFEAIPLGALPHREFLVTRRRSETTRLNTEPIAGVATSPGGRSAPLGDAAASSTLESWGCDLSTTDLDLIPTKPLRLESEWPTLVCWQGQSAR